MTVVVITAKCPNCEREITVDGYLGPDTDLKNGKAQIAMPAVAPCPCGSEVFAVTGYEFPDGEPVLH